MWDRIKEMKDGMLRRKNGVSSRDDLMTISQYDQVEEEKKRDGFQSSPASSMHFNGILRRYGLHSPQRRIRSRFTGLQRGNYKGMVALQRMVFLL